MKLSRSQTKVFWELLQAGDLADIAAKLNLSRATVMNHTRAIYIAYGVSSRVDLMALYLNVSR